MRLNEEILKRQSAYLATTTKGETFSSDELISLKIKTHQEAARDTINKLGQEQILDYQKKAINSLREYYSGRIIFIAFPEMDKKYRDFLQKIVADERNSYLLNNTRDYLKENGGADAVHPNIKGNKIITEDIYDYLKNSKLIGCN